MAEPQDWRSWLPKSGAWKSRLPKSNVWKSWLPKPKGWESWKSEPKGGRSWMSQKTLPNQGVVKQDWFATGRIDFATRDPADANQPSEFKLLVEERRIVESIAGNENLYHKYLSENSLIKTVVETDVSMAPGGLTHLEKH